MLTQQQTDLLDAIAELEVLATSKITGEASEITTYLTQKIATLQAAQTEPATGAQFVTAGEKLALSLANTFGNAKVVTLLADLEKTADDAEAAKVFALPLDLLADYNAVKALKKT